MCIGIWTLEHPDYALILCTNRDEFLDRPTLDAEFHSFGGAVTASSGTDQQQQRHQVLSGRDKLAGGTWFGINRTGKVALLTNITEPKMHYNTSRGNLVSSFLLSSSSSELSSSNPGQQRQRQQYLTSEDQIRNIVPDDAKFAGFNLLLLTPTIITTATATAPLDSGFATTTTTTTKTILRYDESPLLVTNNGGGGSVTSRTLSSSERSCGALSNGIIIVDSADNDADNDDDNAHLWPKVQHATAHFPAVVESRSTDPTDVDELVERLFNLLAWQPQDYTTSQRSEFRKKTIQVSPLLPSSSSSTSSASNNHPSESVTPNTTTTTSYYGTRLSTVLLVRNNGQVVFIERDIWKLGDSTTGVVVPVKSEPPTERKFIFNLDTTTTTIHQ